jgi:hypothetical protein
VLVLSATRKVAEGSDGEGGTMVLFCGNGAPGAHRVRMVVTARSAAADVAWRQRSDGLGAR